MISFLTTPIFFLTPYIFAWSCFNGLITIGLLNFFTIEASRKTKLFTALSTAIASILWNWSIEFNQSTVYLNVDHPIFRISWADALNGVGVFALVSLVLGLAVNPQAPAITLVKIAAIAALTTIVTDTFLF